MRVKIFGSRGSIAVSGPESIRYGGNTAAIEVKGRDGTILILDAGTGIRPLGATLRPRNGRVDILLTHLHMDHIQGLGFFGPIYNPDVESHIWGPASSTMTLPQRLSRYLSPPLFPVYLRDLPRVSFHHVPTGPFEVGSFRIESALVCHPGPTLGYKIEGDGCTIAYLPDHEPALGMREESWTGSEWISGYDLAAGVDLLIHDAQFDDQEYRRCIGWGHSSYRHAFEFAAQAGAKELVTFHHDPSHDDRTLDRLLDDALERFVSPQKVSAGTEGTAYIVEEGLRITGAAGA
jgi:phosphoribosyl 1,2-cyclic phosphodiesterase